MVFDVYIHIGPFKTGSTAIQYFLYHNREVLYNIGYQYLCLPKEKSPVVNSRFITNDIKEKIPQVGAAKSIHLTLDHWLSKMNPSSRRILISDEVLCSQEIEVLREIRSYFLRLKKTIRVIFFLRRQDRVVISNYSQYVKNGGTQKDILVPRNLSDIINYTSFLGNLLSVFDRSELALGLYREGDGAIAKQFLGLIDIDPAGLIWSDAEAHPNRSLSAGAISALIEINQHLRESGIKLTWAEKSAMFQALERKFPGKPALPARNAVKEFLRTFAESNEIIRREFFRDEAELFPFRDDEYEMDAHWITVDRGEAIEILDRITSARHS